jgi:hypothetical protein
MTAAAPTTAMPTAALRAATMNARVRALAAAAAAATCAAFRSRSSFVPGDIVLLVWRYSRVPCAGRPLLKIAASLSPPRGRDATDERVRLARATRNWTRHPLSPPTSTSPVPPHVGQKPLPPQAEQDESCANTTTASERCCRRVFPLPWQAEQLPSPAESQSKQTRLVILHVPSGFRRF